MGETDAFTASEFPTRPLLRPHRRDQPERHHHRGGPAASSRSRRRPPRSPPSRARPSRNSPPTPWSWTSPTNARSCRPGSRPPRSRSCAPTSARTSPPRSPRVSRPRVADLAVDATAFDHFVFLGHGWTVGLANEAALKMREAAQAHTEAYPAMEYRHGPISLAGPGSLVWVLGTPDPAVADDVRATGATVMVAEGDPMAELVLIQRSAVARRRRPGPRPRPSPQPDPIRRAVVMRRRKKMKRRSLFVLLTVMALDRRRVLGRRRRLHRRLGLRRRQRRAGPDHAVARLRRTRRAQRGRELRSGLDAAADRRVQPDPPRHRGRATSSAAPTTTRCRRSPWPCRAASSPTSPTSTARRCPSSSNAPGIVDLTDRVAEADFGLGRLLPAARRPPPPSTDGCSASPR